MGQERKANVEVTRHELDGDSALGMLLSALIDRTKEELEDKDKERRKVFREITRQEVLDHLKQTAYMPEPLDVVALNKFGKKTMKFPEYMETMTVVRVLDKPLYDHSELFSSKGGIGFNVILACITLDGRVVEMIYPSTHLELVERVS